MQCEKKCCFISGNKRLLPVFTTGGSAGSPPSKRLRRDMAESKESLTTPEGEQSPCYTYSIDIHTHTDWTFNL